MADEVRSHFGQAVLREAREQFEQPVGDEAHGDEERRAGHAKVEVAGKDEIAGEARILEVADARWVYAGGGQAVVEVGGGAVAEVGAERGVQRRKHLHRDEYPADDGEEHERTYGHRAGPEEPVELVAIQLVGIGLRDDGGALQRAAPSRAAAVAPSTRKAWFGDKHGWLDTPVLSRADLSASRAGPLIVEEYDATCVVPPGARAECDEGGNIVIALARV